LVAVAKHEVTAREAHGGAGCALVAVQVHDARDPKLAAYDRERVIVVAHRQVPPRRKIVSLATLVDRHRCAAIEKDEGSSRRRELDGLEVSVQNEDTRAKDVRQRAPREE